MKCGLLGRKLGHSYSPQIHSYLGSYPYALYEKEPEEIEYFLKNSDFTAINVTIPYKKDVIPHCTELSDQAKRLGAVNTIVKRSNGTVIGHNTDYFGFEFMVKKSGLDLSGKKALVFGTGGASNTAVAALREKGADVVVISHKDNVPENLMLHSDAKVIVNATPEGMYPRNGSSPADLNIFPQLEGVLDMVYNPSRTKLLLDASSRGLVAENGLWMLVAQAKEAAEWFTNTTISDDVITDIYNKLRRKMENIVLIGMPGSGKSFIGSLLAQRLSRTFVDTDTLITEIAGKSIPYIFADDGEDVFRCLETKALEDVGKQSGLIIATGGGCVTRKVNYPLLRQNSTVIWLQRDLEVLPTDGRPLSQAGSLSAMYEKRKKLYAAFADHTVSNDGSVEETAANILSCL